MVSAGPYRTSSDEARFVCLVCYSLSSSAGPCRTCGVDRLALAEPEVRDQVRAEAERRLQRRAYREYVVLSIVGMVVLSPLVVFAGVLVAALIPVGVIGLARLYTAINRDSAIGIMASRRRRISRALGVDIQIGGVTHHGHAMKPELPDKYVGGEDATDPETLDLTRLLKWMGARMEK